MPVWCSSQSTKRPLMVASLMGLLLLASTGWSTSVVVMVRDDELAIAADSLLIEPGGRHESICKIHRAGQLYFATAGLLRKSEAGFFLDAIAGQACATTSDPDSAAKVFSHLIGPPLLKAMAYSRIHSPQLYKKDYLGRQAVVSVIFAGYSDKTPRVVMDTLDLDRVGSLRETTISLSDKTGRNVLQVGQTKADDEYETSHPEWADVKALADLVKLLVQIEVRQEPQLVGPPISILYASPSGWRWIERGLCGN